MLFTVPTKATGIASTFPPPAGGVAAVPPQALNRSVPIVRTNTRKRIFFISASLFFIGLNCRYLSKIDLSPQLALVAIFAGRSRKRFKTLVLRDLHLSVIQKKA